MMAAAPALRSSRMRSHRRAHSRRRSRRREECPRRILRNRRAARRPRTRTGILEVGRRARVRDPRGVGAGRRARGRGDSPIDVGASRADPSARSPGASASRPAMPAISIGPPTAQAPPRAPAPPKAVAAAADARNSVRPTAPEMMTRGAQQQRAGFDRRYVRAPPQHRRSRGRLRVDRGGRPRRRSSHGVALTDLAEVRVALRAARGESRPSGARLHDRPALERGDDRLDRRSASRRCARCGAPRRSSS